LSKLIVCRLRQLLPKIALFTAQEDAWR